MRLAVFIVLTLAPALIPASAQPDMAAGQRSYEVCAGCHGFVGEGNRLVGAPRLAGIDTWYLERQIRNFKAQRRGHAQGDANGQRMALMAQAIAGDRELGDVLAWIGTLPEPAASVPAAEAEATSTDASRGAGLYALCAACHGTEGHGNESLGAPALVSLDDWYLIEQLELFAEGLRGADPGDTYGAQMRALASSFDTDDERRALAAFIDTLAH
jgi:cytochrome c oxidase subunit 2